MFDIDRSKQYGILISGGLDSAVLLSLLAKYHSDIKLQPFTIDKTDGSMFYANPIIDYVNDRFGTTFPKTIVVGDPTLEHTKQGPSAVKEILQNYKHIDYILFGTNKNPPVTLPGINPVRIKPPTANILCPFFDLYKTDIVNLAIEHNLQDLFNITHSCTEQQVGRCNDCWQCRERAWAFNELNMIDKGTF
jgi:hypothetical protein